jgi:hypothetical protein
MQDRVQELLWFYGHFVHDGVNIYRKGFRRKRKRGANAVVEQLQTLYAKSKPSNKWSSNR